MSPANNMSVQRMKEWIGSNVCSGKVAVPMEHDPLSYSDYALLRLIQS